ncbi:MAG TPA: thioredoxin [Chitinophagaceae bacterium]|nr:thioredoxin [Chitinophagaceae bacterium]
MKRSLLLPLLLLVAFVSFSQQDSTQLPPFKRFPTVPPFKLLKIDSTSYFTKNDLKKNKPVLIILFNPDCDHCKHEIEDILKNMDDLKNVQIVLSTMMPFSLMKSFYEKYSLERFDNITVGQDFQYLLPTFYQIHFMPYLAMYDKKGNLVTTFEGTMKIQDLVNVYK